MSLSLKTDKIILPLEQFAKNAQEKPNQVYLRQPKNRQVTEYTWVQAYDKTLRLAAAFKAMGLKPGDKVSILSSNCAEWFITDFAILAAGLVSVPIYFTAGKKTISYILEHSEAKAIVVGKLADYSNAEQAIPEDMITISMPYDTMPCKYEFEKLIEENQPLNEVHPASEDDVFTISYTSGSTGNPKGVVLTYKNIMFGATRMLDAPGRPAIESVVSYLPLAHITERALVEYASLYGVAQISFIESLETFVEDLKDAKVTTFISVPRLWMKFQAGVLAKLPQKKLDFLFKIPILNNIVKRKIRDQLGLGHSLTFGSGSAPIAPSVLEWYESIGIEISEGWGMTEVTGAATTQMPFRADKIGTIGPALDDVQLKVSDEGELLVKGDGVFKEYYKNEEVTKETFTEDGWMRTGDQAIIDDEGYLKITGRVKEIFKSGKGKYVAPVPIESLMGQNQLIEQICVMGSGLPAPVSVVVISKETSEGLDKQQITDSLKATLESVNQDLEAHEKMSGIYVASDEWTVENGLLTPTLKIKRTQLEEKYNDEINRDWSEVVVWQ